ncbi:extracellular solute-binding protein [Gloeothece verrucosa]|uniref:Extracellular solute-binding protein family 1 n=1 Tax=Gloeothece verrucosa (strain PCC 7822) TaxID=497965 RepID=E0UDK1_GLOV7|nr:extracellular solute-binding protein [Gloeothece verrucosa]ADN15314.1 extracellular solute-binding protein family 1 [Gloeothece verrucosa PCC 7822]
MVRRRSFLLAVGTVALAQILTGCNSDEAAFRVLLLDNSIPSQLIGDFRSSISSKSIFTLESQLKTLLKLLQTWQAKDLSKPNKNSGLPFINKKPAPVPDLVTLGDSWLATAIEQKLISPLEGDLKWQQLPPRWQEIVRRDEQGMVSQQGKIWGAPYRWGTTMIAYRKDNLKKLGWEPKDWGDLWREDVRNRISLLDQPREVIGLTLKKLGYSYNSDNINQIPNLKSDLVALNKQAKFYSSDHYLEPLILGDTWLAVGWSHEIIPLLKNYRDIAAVVPQSGTALWADIWVKPAAVIKPSKFVQDWINFCWQSKSAKEISLFTDAVSPVILELAPENLPQAIRDNPLLLIDKNILEKSDFIKPLPASVEKQYENLWREIRVAISD